MKEGFIRYSPGMDPEPIDKSDWERVDRMTDEEVKAAALSDPDVQPMTDEELARMFIERNPEAVAQALQD